MKPEISESGGWEHKYVHRVCVRRHRRNRINLFLLTSDDLTGWLWSGVEFVDLWPWNLVFSMPEVCNSSRIDENYIATLVVCFCRVFWYNFCIIWFV